MQLPPVFKTESPICKALFRTKMYSFCISEVMDFSDMTPAPPWITKAYFVGVCEKDIMEESNKREATRRFFMVMEVR
jgi:hypothetical protein